MGRFFTELQRRKVYQVAAVYAAVAWVLVQMGAIVAATFFAPAWIMQMFVTLLILGFAPAMTFAWAFERTPGGLKRTRSETGKATPLAKPRDAWLAYAVSGLLVIIAGWLFLSMEYIDPNNVAGTRSASPISPAIDISKSIAVLPFVNLSPDPDNAYFAAGIHEEILSQLARVSDLHVISRSAVMQFANSASTTNEIGNVLNVGSIIEGQRAICWEPGPYRHPACQFG